MRTRHLKSALVLAVALGSLGRARSASADPVQPVITGPDVLSAGVTAPYAISIADPTAVTGDLIVYSVTWGDGTWVTGLTTVSNASVSLTHAWPMAGTFQIHAQIQNLRTFALSPQGSLTVTVTAPANQAPLAPPAPGGPPSVSHNMATAWSASTTDPDGDSILYSFDWGDGVVTTSVFYVESGGTVWVNHAWSQPGSYGVRVRATDSRGASSAWSAATPVQILNRAPYAPGAPVGPASGTRNASYAYAASSIDPEGDAVRITFDWGDGTTTTTSAVASGTLASALHRWTRKGTYTVRAFATDSFGARSPFSASRQVVIR